MAHRALAGLLIAVAACSGGGDLVVGVDGAPDAYDAGPPLPEVGVELGALCGPPDPYITADRLAEVKAAGFTLVGPPCDGSITAELNQRILAAAQAAGLRVLISDPRLPTAITGVADATTQLDAVLAAYAAHPALAGYVLVNDPGVASFTGLGEVAAYLREHDPDHVTYINLAPAYTDLATLGAASYADYLQQFVSVVKPALLAYHHYPFLTTGDRPDFVANLALMQRHANERGVPFWLGALAVQHGAYRSPTAPEKRWETMQAVVHGARGVLFYAYWTPADASFGPALIDRTGARTAHYDDVTAINRDAQTIGRWLASAKLMSVFEEGVVPAGGTLRPSGAPVLVLGENPVTVGVFVAPEGSYALIVNGNYAAAAPTDLYLAVDQRAPQRLDRTAGTWTDLQVLGGFEGTSRVHLELAAGDAELVRVSGAFADGPVGPAVLFGRVRAGVGTLYRVDQTLGVSRVYDTTAGTCPTGYSLVGQDNQANGFWLCARPDVAGRIFWIGNVVGDVVSFWRLQASSVNTFGAVAWDTCMGSSVLVGHLQEANGFWVCMQ